MKKKTRCPSGEGSGLRCQLGYDDCYVSNDLEGLTSHPAALAHMYGRIRQQRRRQRVRSIYRVVGPRFPMRNK